MLDLEPIRERAGVLRANYGPDVKAYGDCNDCYLSLMDYEAMLTEIDRLRKVCNELQRKHSMRTEVLV